MFVTANVQKVEQRLLYERIPPELAVFLKNAELNSFTPIVPDGKGGNMSFYLKEIEKTENKSYDDVKNQIINQIMGDKREQVLSDYFARLQGNADIQVIREAK